MGPKKKGDEINASELPPWISLKIVLKYQGKKERYQKLIENIRN